MESIDTAVIGAGVVGLACARALALAGREVWVLEAADAIGQGVSSRNLRSSTPASTTRAAAQGAAVRARQGAALRLRRPARRGHSRCGKLIVAGTPQQEAELDGIAARAAANGVADLRRLTGAEARALEPQLHCRAALLSPSTGIVDSHGLMLALQAIWRPRAARWCCTRAWTAAPARPTASCCTSPLPEGERMALKARQVVNAASLHAPDLPGTLRAWTQARCQRPAMPKRAILACRTRALRAPDLPAPQDAWLGVHFTLDLGGQAKFGPRPAGGWTWPAQRPSTTASIRRAARVYAEVRRYRARPADGALQPAYSGVRPKIHHAAPRA